VVVHRDSIAVRREGAAQVALVGPPNVGAMVLCHDASAPVDDLHELRTELAAAGVDLPTIIAATKVDEAVPADVERLAAALPELEVVGVSALDDASLEAFRDAVLRLTGLIRVFLRHEGGVDADPVALEPPATRRRRRSGDPPRPGEALHRCTRLGTVGTLPGAARRSLPRSRGRRRGGDP